MLPAQHAKNLRAVTMLLSRGMAIPTCPDTASAGPDNREERQGKQDSMPWQNNSGGGGPWGGGGRGGSGDGGGQSPWGRPSGGGGGGNRPPPDVEEMVRKGQERLKGLMPGGIGRQRPVLRRRVGRGGLARDRLLPGRTEPAGRGTAVRQTFMKRPVPAFSTISPSPIGTVLKPQVTDVNQEQIGFRTRGGGTRTSSVQNVDRGKPDAHRR